MPGSRSSRSTRTARAAWGSISREIVVDRAVEIVGRAGAAELSFRSLATELGVTPMALYRHVENKDDLLGEVVNRLLADRWRPRIAEDPWQPWIADAADRLRRFLVDEPAALQVYLRRPVTSSTALERMAVSLDVLRRGLGDDARAHDAYASVQTYTLGFAAVEAARHVAQESAEPEGEPETARELASYTSPEQFRRGLGYLLRGLSAV